MEQKEKKALELAKTLCEESLAEMTLAEKKEWQRRHILLQDPNTLTCMTRMVDELFWPKKTRGIAKRVRELVATYRPLQSKELWKERFGLKCGLLLSYLMPSLFVFLVKQWIRLETKTVMLSAEEEPLRRHLAKRNQEGAYINLNHLGEAILGEEHAKERIALYKSYLARKDLSVVSVKLSSLTSQIHLFAYEKTRERVVERLRGLLRVGGSCQVHLDMEEWKDCHLSFDAYVQVMSEEEFLHTSCGIALQSYLPGSFDLQKQIVALSKKRMEKGGAPLKIRLVKGANLAQERTEASLHGWRQAPYLTKQETDANFIRMLQYGIEHLEVCRLGIGSHNLFDIAYGLVIEEEKKKSGVSPFPIELEMLEGMAEPFYRALQKRGKHVLLYTPVAYEEEFPHAVSYLIRRLDENATPGNFLREMFAINPAAPAWQEQEKAFIESLSHEVGSSDRRLKPLPTRSGYTFTPDSDPTVRSVREAVAKKLASSNVETLVPCVVGGQVIESGTRLQGVSPDALDTPLFSYIEGTQEMAYLALETAKKCFAKWSALEIEEKITPLERVATLLLEKQDELASLMMKEVGKSCEESFVELREAVDACRYALHVAKEWYQIEELSYTPVGTVVVVSPWNFPLAIPCNGIASALAAGNVVIFKPAPEAVLIGYALACCFWEAGISKEVLQFVTGDAVVGEILASDPGLGALVLTGATETARHLLSTYPRLPLLAETGGKNTLIATDFADRDLLVKDVVASAFGFSGQKCSALSLLILEKTIYNDPDFKELLVDATKSWPVGSPCTLETGVTPLIHPLNAKQKRAFETLEEGEEWLVQPKKLKENLYTPGIKWGVRPGSYTFTTEFFAPLLGVVCADSLSHAVEMANQTPYGLTAGLHSLNPKEHSFWQERIVAGNLYSNRTITGAVIQRQPFGGTKESQFGAGWKAGGPNYFLGFTTPEATSWPKQKSSLETASLDPARSLFVEKVKELVPLEEMRTFACVAKHFQIVYEDVFSQKEDPQKILGQDNFFLYTPYPVVFLRGTMHLELLLSIFAALLTKTPLEISISASSSEKAYSKKLFAHLPPTVRWIIEDAETFVERMKRKTRPRVRLLQPLGVEKEERLASCFATLLTRPFVPHGRVELLHYLREQAVSCTTHRFGYLGERADERRCAEFCGLS